ncbi:hypothetical protein EDD29_5438 [Actinocorallia herbida]|uniref:DUF11 domain-containing protein n=1 Tax=Actinocorallia herbida TaxID=58109 RepID=A0A3N1D2U5_9ACTN|nr:DUF11 domain-containing protein [Actinocorallia herbida]ROO87796.1 hypothetical protein EDD29_5438 [Actinocorallia herbida]
MRLRSLLSALALAGGLIVAIAAPASAHPTLTVTASPTTVPAATTTTITISGTSNGNYSGARIDVSATGGTGGTTGTLPSFTSISSFSGGLTSATEVGSVDRLALPNLTNGQAFSYDLTVTVDSATAAGTFTSRAQFYTSGGSTTGAVNGPVITVTPAAPDLSAIKLSYGYKALTQTLNFNAWASNIGTGTATNVTLTKTVSPSGLLTSAIGAGCTGGADNETCPQSDVPAGGLLSTTFPRTVNLLALGNYTVTMTFATPGDTDPTNNSATWTCTVLTGLIVTCT